MGKNAPENSVKETLDPGIARAWDSITLARFLPQLPPGIRVVHDAGDRPLRWVEPSDIDDPTDYLLPHELILTSGFPLVGRADDAEHVRGFVARLSQAKVSALGFGLHPYFTSIPATVVQACRELDMTLWEIPASVPFAAVGLAFARLMEIDGARMLRENAEANRQLMKCVASEQPEQEITSVLASRAKATVQLFGPTGRLRHYAATEGTRAVDGPELSTLLAEVHDSPGSKLVLHESCGWYHLAFPIRAATATPGRVPPLLGVLQLTFARDPGSAEHNVMSTAFGLLELVARQRNLGSFAPTQLATALLLGQREVPDPEALKLFNASLGGSWRRPPRVAMVLPQQPGPELEPAHALTRLRSLLETRLVLHRDGRFTAVTRAEPTPQLFAQLEEAGYLLAVSEPMEHTQHGVDAREFALAGSLRSLAAQAQGLLPRVMEERRCLSADQLPLTFTALLPAAAARELAQRTLAGLLELPEKRRDLYLGVLRAWLASNGSWDATATAIDLHRNSVRRHIASIGELLESDLSLVEVRTELFLSLQMLN